MKTSNSLYTVFLLSLFAVLMSGTASATMLYHFPFDENTSSNGSIAVDLNQGPGTIQTSNPPVGTGYLLDGRYGNTTQQTINVSNGFSATGWVKGPGNICVMCLQGHDGEFDSAPPNYLGIYTDGATLFVDTTVDYYNTSYYLVQSAPFTTNDNWTFLAVTFNGSDFTFYENAVQIGSVQNAAGTIADNLVFLGVTVGPAFGTTGSFTDDNRFYDVALTQEEIDALYALKNPEAPAENVSVAPPALGGGGRIVKSTTTETTIKTTTETSTNTVSAAETAEPTLFGIIAEWFKNLFS